MKIFPADYHASPSSGPYGQKRRYTWYRPKTCPILKASTQTERAGSDSDGRRSSLTFRLLWLARSLAALEDNQHRLALRGRLQLLGAFAVRPHADGQLVSIQLVDAAKQAGHPAH